MRLRLLITGISLFATLQMVGWFFAPANLVTAHPLDQSTGVATPAVSHYWTETFQTVQAIDAMSSVDVDTVTGQVHLTLRDTVAQQTTSVAKGPNQELYVVWQDLRNDDGDIYAQRVDATGQRLWAADLRVNSDSGQTTQSAPTATTDALGNLIVAWADQRNGHHEIYGQRIDPTGHAQWLADVRFHVDTSNADHDQPALAFTGSVLVVTWHDNRSGNYNIYAQQLRVDDGSSLWPNDRQVNSDPNNAAQINPAISSDGNGGAVIVWLDQRIGNGDIYAQHLTAQGVLLWATESQLNAALVAGAGHPSLAASHDGWIVTWLGANDFVVYAQRLNAAGQTTWPTNLSVNAYTQQADPESAPLAATLASGEVLIAWVSAQDGLLYGQRLAADGGLRWTPAHRLNHAPSQKVNCHHLAAVGLTDDRVLLAWADDRNDEQLDIFGQVVDADGALAWHGDRGISTPLGMVSQDAAVVAAAPDGGGVVAWRDTRRARPALYLQRLDAAGNRLWSDRIVADQQVVSTTSQLAPAVALLGDDTLVAWSDERSGQARIYLQRFDARGFRQWNAPLAVSPSPDVTLHQFNPVMRTNRQGQIFIAWEALLGDSRRIALQQLDPTGARQWPNDLIAPVTAGTPRFPTLGATGDTVILAWLSEQLGETDLLMARADPTGKFLWSVPVQVNRFAGLVDQFNPPTVAVHDNGDAVATWVDKRNYAVYAQRVDPLGALVWQADVQVNETPGTVLPAPDVAALPGGEAIFTWQGVNNGEFTVIAQRVDKNGNRLWPTEAAGGVVVSSLAHQVQRPKVASDASGDALILWLEQRRQNSDIFSQRLNSQGVKIWADDQALVAPDRFFAQQGFVRSKTVVTSEQSIAEATLSADLSLHGGQIAFWLSNDGGAHWAHVEPNVPYHFTTSGVDLRWQATLRTNPRDPTHSPIIRRLALLYAANVTAGAAAQEPDNSCLQAHPLQLAGAPQARLLTSTDGIHPDEDWVQLYVEPGTMYDLWVTPGEATNALRLEGYQDCAAQTAATAVDAAAGLHLRIKSTSNTFFARVIPVSSTVAAAIPYTISFRQASSVGLAILVDGPLSPGDAQQPQVDQAVARAYRTLLAHGYNSSQIFYLSHNLTQDVTGDGVFDVDQLATSANWQHALENWPIEQWNTQADTQPLRVLLYLVGHGDANGFYTSDNQVVSSATLDRWIANLEAASPVDQITVVVDANAAGAFSPDAVDGITQNSITKTIAGPNRLVVAATSPAGLAWPTSRGMLFSDTFWAALDQGGSLAQSFAEAQQAIAASGYACVGAATLCQQPLLADGRPLDDVSGLSLADGWSLPAPYLATGPVIDQGQVIWQKGDVNGVIQASVRGVTPGGRVEAHILPPDFFIAAPTPGHLPAQAGLIVPLQWTGDFDHQSAALYTGLFDGFIQTGPYQIAIYAWDAEDRSAPPRLIHFTTETHLFLPLIFNRK
ncbi:MAG: hypothetical protein NT075_00885 [Chloroflexi bacterium]|nr:hypothetical protein [Chloroflexota bacterium]